MIKAGFIGAGGVAPIHKLGIDSLEDVEVVSLVKKDQKTAHQRADEMGISGVSRSYHEMLANPDIDVVHCLLPNSLHHGVIKAAIESGKHVMAEKPLTVTLEEATELVHLAERSGLVCSVNFRYRYYRAVQEIRQKVLAGEIGEVRLVHGSFLQDWLSETTDYSWRLEPTIGGNSGTFADIGSHWFDIIHYVLGQKITRVLARLGTFVSNRIDSAERAITVHLEDSATVLFELEKGAIGTMAVSQVATGRSMSHLCFEINGSRSSVSWNREHPDELWVGYRDKPNQIIHHSQDHHLSWESGVRKLMARFYGAVKAFQNGGFSGKSPDYPTFQDGLQSMRVLEAVLKSDATLSWVDVEY